MPPAVSRSSRIPRTRRVLVDFLARIISQLHVLGRNAIFGHVARLPDDIPAHQAMLRQVDPQTLHGNVHQVDHVPNGPTNSTAITTMFPLRLCGGKLLVAVTRQRRYGPSRLRVNDDDDDDFLGASTNHTSALCAAVVKTDCMHEVGPPSPISGRVNVSAVARGCPTVAPRINNAFSRLL